jgi:hypothetical protein
LLVYQLQIVSHFNKVVEIGFKTGTSPINKEIVEQVLKPSDSDLELRYARAGYRISTISKMLSVPGKTVKLWFMGKLPEQQAIEFEESLVQANIIV